MRLVPGVRRRSRPSLNGAVWAAREELPQSAEVDDRPRRRLVAHQLLHVEVVVRRKVFTPKKRRSPSSPLEPVLIGAEGRGAAGLQSGRPAPATALRVAEQGRWEKETALRREAESRIGTAGFEPATP